MTERTETTARTDPPSRGSQLAWLGVAAAIAIAVLTVHAARQLPFVADDALISLRYAARLLDGHGLTWTDGETVEGYSNLLWVLACAGLGALDVDLIDAARALGFVAMAGTLAIVAAWAARPWPALAGGLALALCTPMAVWTIGGLEQPLVAVLLAWAMLAARPVVENAAVARPWRAGVPLALLCLARPDAPVLVAAIAAALVVVRGRVGLGLAARLIALPLAAFVGQTVFRVLYYGDVISNPARAKLGLTSERVASGLSYVSGGGHYLAGLWLVAAIAVGFGLRRRALRPRLALLTLPLLAWLAYVACVGGDIFPARRQLIPAIVLAGFLFVEAVAAVATRSRWLAALTAGLGLAGLVVLGPRDPAFQRVRHERWEWDGKQIGELLRAAFGPDRPLLAVDPAGTLPYFSRLPSLDMLGLNDRWLAMHPPPGFGSGYMGHELGNGAYVLGRRPDLVIVCSPAGRETTGCFLSGREMIALPEFQRDYVLLAFETPSGFRSMVWARREGGPIGLRRTAGALVIPGYLLAASDKTPAALDGERRLGSRVADPPARLAGVALDAGPCQIELDASGPAIVTLRTASSVVAEGPAPLAAIAPGGPVTVELRSAGGTIHVRAVRIAAKH